MVNQTVYSLFLSSKEGIDETTGDGNTDYTELLENLQKSLDAINEKLETKEEEQGSVKTGDDQMALVLEELKQIRKIQYEDYHWFVYSIILGVGVLFWILIYRMFKKFTY